MRTWTGTFNLTTRGAWSLGGALYPHYPSYVVEGQHEHNCLGFTLRGVHLLGLHAVASWEPSATEQKQMAFHYLKDNPGPFRGTNHTIGESPLSHDWTFDNESTHWLHVGVHPQDMAVDRGDADFTFNVVLTYRSYNGSEPAFLGPTWCFYPDDLFNEFACVAGGCQPINKR